MSTLTPQSKDFSAWYNEVVLAAGLADYSDVKGCMVIKPYGYALWENIQKILDAEIKKMGVANVYLPLLIPESYFKKEAEHVSGFAPEVAWVTEAGGKKLEEKLALRPTSETIMYRTFANWISSYRDLPLKVNQWANIVRWEMRTRLFLRTTEFLWQEGHTLHKSPKEAAQMVDAALKMYKNFVNKYLAIEVLSGVKSQSEKFAGAEYTKSIEGIMKDGRALQMGTSHSLGQNFAKTFEVKYLNENNQEQTPWPTSWGVSTRLIGGIIMAHGDDKGLILPPKIAPIQLIVVPIWKTTEEKEKITTYLKKITKQLTGIKYHLDFDESKSPGWKFNQWELKGVPLRLEVGPKDELAQQIVLVRRDNGEKNIVKLSDIKSQIKIILKKIQDNLWQQNKNFLANNLRNFDNYENYKKESQDTNFPALIHWCGKSTCEEKIKIDTKATTRVYSNKKSSGNCLVCGSKTKDQVYIAKAY